MKAETVVQRVLQMFIFSKTMESFWKNAWNAFFCFLLVKLQTHIRSSHREMYCKKCVFKIVAKFIRKHPASLLKKRLRDRLFPVNFAQFLKTPPVSASDTIQQPYYKIASTKGQKQMSRCLKLFCRKGVHKNFVKPSWKYVF